MSGADTTNSARRMSADEAAAKADALIAQHRASRAPRRERPMLAVTQIPGSAGVRFNLLLLFGVGVATGLCWRPYPMVSLTLCVIALPLALRILRAITDAPTAAARRR